MSGCIINPLTFVFFAVRACEREGGGGGGGGERREMDRKRSSGRERDIETERMRERQRDTKRATGRGRGGWRNHAGVHARGPSLSSVVSQVIEVHCVYCSSIQVSMTSTMTCTVRTTPVVTSI